MQNRSISLAAYTFAHFCVDFACVFSLYRYFSPSMSSFGSSTGFLLYSAIAFGLQAPLGALCDKYHKLPAGLIGCGLVMAGVLCFPAPWLALALYALGNAFFHVGGGIDSLVHAGGKMTRSGIFVSSGAIGVALGAMLGQQAWAGFALPLCLIIACTILLLPFRPAGRPAPVSFGTVQGVKFGGSAALALLFVAISIRSYGGFIIPMPWKADFLLLPGIGACLGKALGGILADRLGARQVASISLLACIPLLCLGVNAPGIAFAGILLFNMNMPVTLCAIADRLRGSEGLAFGVTTLALLCGAILPFFYILPTELSLYLLPVLCAVSAFFIWICIGTRRKSRNTAPAVSEL